MCKQKICAIIVAGGKGRRMGGKIPKQFIKIDTIPIIIKTLLPFEKLKAINSIILILPKKWKQKGFNLLRKYHINKVIEIADAGRTRQVSVYNGLVSLKKYNPDIVVIHDVARPFVTEKLIKASCEGAKKHGATSTAITIRDTIVEKRKMKLLDRKNVIRLQTPQAFRFPLILDAHLHAKKRKKCDYPDDSSLLLSFGGKTFLIDGDKRNIKITDKEDLQLAHAIAKTL